MTSNTAYLSNNGDIICFYYDGRRIRFRGPYSLMRFDHVKEWDNGYIEVMTRFSHTEELIEEYIDLVPILSNLYIDPEKFLESIEKVEARNA